MASYSINLMSGGASFDPAGQTLNGAVGNVNGGNFISNWPLASAGTWLVKQTESTATFTNTLDSPVVTGTTEFGQVPVSTLGGLVFSEVFTANLTNTTPANIASISLNDNTLTSVDVEISAISRTSTAAAQWKLGWAWARNSASAPVALGSMITGDYRNTGAPATSWTATLTVSGNFCYVQVVSDSTLSVDWMVLVQWRQTT